MLEVGLQSGSPFDRVAEAASRSAFFSSGGPPDPLAHDLRWFSPVRLQWSLVVSRGLLRFPVDPQGVQWFPAASPGFPCPPPPGPTVIHRGIPWDPVGFRGISWVGVWGGFFGGSLRQNRNFFSWDFVGPRFVGSRGIPWDPVGSRGIPWDSVGFHWSP